MKRLALLGRKLGHTFSPRYFAEKFDRESITGYHYGTMELADISEFPTALEEHPELIGLNVTIPYKLEVMEYLDQLDETAAAIGAVNTIRITDEGLIGYNTDVIGFQRSLEAFLPENFAGSALILGTGGSSKAVRFVLERMKIPYKLVSRKPVTDGYTYEDMDEETVKYFSLIINTTPLGMYPEVDRCPDIPYAVMDENYYLFDLIYNPEETLFMKKGKQQGAKVSNGYMMLEQQAEASWEIWTK